MIVLDATVVAKWYLPEPGSDRAEAFAEEAVEVCAPAILRLEVLSAISRRYRTGGINASDAETMMAEWLEDLETGTPKLWPDDDDLESALRLSLRIRHAVVDCLYLACAMRLDTDLVTADENLFRRARGIHGKIRIL